jgi:hypothetical protein
MGTDFWAALDNDDQVFKGDDSKLLGDIFNPKLADRRAEGDSFIPPDASHNYVTKLRALVKDEESVRQRRMTQFFSKDFAMNAPGPLFPSSWTSSFEVARDGLPRGALVARPDYKEQAAELLQEVLQESSPVFDKNTEEGLRFRVYRLGSLEVRTTQAVGCEEVVGAVFSSRAETASNDKNVQAIADQEKIKKATEYVERIAAATNANNPGARRRYYAVLETESGRKIRTERMASGAVSWEVEPEDLEDRNSLAKVTRGGEAKASVIVGDMKAYQASFSAITGGAKSASPSTCKRYARTVVTRAIE